MGGREGGRGGGVFVFNAMQCLRTGQIGAGGGENITKLLCKDLKHFDSAQPPE